jgi:hypothetical protein
VITVPRQRILPGKDAVVIRRLLLVAATVFGVVVVPAGPAQAIPACKSGYACLYQWWADREHTVFRGFRSIDCQGAVVSSGTLSGYLEFNQSRCNSR